MSTLVSMDPIQARIVTGHRVASGRNGNPRFPGGTLRMQVPHFAKLGLDLTPFYLGTLNICISPYHYRVLRPRHTFRQVKWHPTEPAEDFSFFDVRLIRENEAPVDGFVYYPHPETKPEHFQPPDILELLFPHVKGLSYGDEIHISIPSNQMSIEK